MGTRSSSLTRGEPFFPAPFLISNVFRDASASWDVDGSDDTSSKIDSDVTEPSSEEEEEVEIVRGFLGMTTG